MSRAWMPIYWGDYIAGTAHLSTEEHGAYLLLIAHYWVNQGLPTADEKLARIVGLSLQRWRKIKPTIEQFFQKNWQHKRIEFELTEAARISAASRAAGVASGVSRRSKRTTVEGPLNERSNERSTDREPLPSQSPTEIEAKASISVVPLAAKRGEPLPKDWQPSDADLKDAGRIGLRLYEIEHEIPKFIDYWHAKAGAGAIKRDWSATWRNWCRGAIERRGKQGGGNGRQLQDDRLSVSKAADRLIESGAEPPPRPSLVPRTGEADRRLLPKG